MLSLTRRLAIAAEVFANEISLAALGIRKLTLDATNAAVPDVFPTELREFWQFVGEPPPQAKTTAFASTMSVARGDLWRKMIDQHPSVAGRGRTPQGFEPLRIDVDGAAPLRAFRCKPSSPTKPTVMLLHGMYDSKQSSYLHAIGRMLAKAGFGVVIPDYRWHGELYSEEWLPTLGVAEANDLVAWARALTAEHPSSPLLLLGFSLGALYAIRALAAEGGELFKGAIAVSPPAALDLTIVKLDTRPSLVDHGFNFFIRRFFHQSLRTRLQYLRCAREPQAFAGLIRWLSGRLQRPQFLADADPAAHMMKIKRPLLVLASQNDPLFPSAATASLAAAAASNPFVRILQTPTGGHIGHAGCYPQWFAALCTRFAAVAPHVREAEAVVMPTLPVIPTASETLVAQV